VAVFAQEELEDAREGWRPQVDSSRPSRLHVWPPMYGHRREPRTAHTPCNREMCPSPLSPGCHGSWLAASSGRLVEIMRNRIIISPILLIINKNHVSRGGQFPFACQPRHRCKI
jgi:hypothetical protein